MTTPLRSAFLSLAAVLLADTTAVAAVPPEVMEPYRAYAAAMEAGDKEATRKAAKKAYRASLKAEGLKPSMQAALAHNYAATISAAESKEAIELYRRAIALTPGEDQLNAERHVRIGEIYAYNPRYAAKNLSAMRKHMAEGLAFMEATGQLDTTFGAELLVLQGVELAARKRHDQALNNLDKALGIFESDAHTYPSVLRYQAHLVKGEVLRQDDKPIDAALALQEVFQNLEGDLSEDHPFIKTAFNQWLFARGIIETEGLTDQAIEAGVCKCWPYDKIAGDTPLPMRRVPPMMPSNAKRSGHVILRFDVNAQGRPINVTPVASTQGLFVKPAVAAVKQWIYDISQIKDPVLLSGLSTKITFRLTNTKGDVIPEPDKLTILDEAGLAAHKAANAQ